ncbi:MAG TPA: pyrroline-5-carboxylate reductase [Acidimicrobiia bacterium]|nr:pyrroline-5-carboxylate reductase [Acidimicrobiia bacterium]
MPEHPPSTRPSVAILGAGAMGEALLRGLIAAGWRHSEIGVASRRKERAEAVSEATGARVSLDPLEAITGRRVVVAATKPRDVVALLDQVAGKLAPPQVVVSVAAGVPIRLFEARLPGVAVVRAMPNTPALVGEGVTGIAAGTHADKEAIEAATTVLEAVSVVRQMDESLMDAVTAVSGTGPAYVFLLAEALTEAAIREGLPRDIAEILVHQTVRGAGHLLTETGRSPGELRGQVTSPGGTTAAAVHILEESGFRALVEDAVRAAAERARQLGESAR